MFPTRFATEATDEPARTEGPSGPCLPGPMRGILRGTGALGALAALLNLLSLWLPFWVSEAVSGVRNVQRLIDFEGDWNQVLVVVLVQGCLGLALLRSPPRRDHVAMLAGASAFLTCYRVLGPLGAELGSERARAGYFLALAAGLAFAAAGVAAASVLVHRDTLALPLSRRRLLLFGAVAALSAVGVWSLFQEWRYLAVSAAEAVPLVLSAAWVLLLPAASLLWHCRLAAALVAGWCVAGIAPLFQAVRSVRGPLPYVVALIGLVVVSRALRRDPDEPATSTFSGRASTTTARARIGAEAP